MKKFFTMIALINLISISEHTIASENIALTYNIIPDISNGYVIDSNHTNHLTFSLFENENDLFFNDNILKIVSYYNEFVFVN